MDDIDPATMVARPRAADSTGSNDSLIVRSMLDAVEVVGFVVEVTGEVVVDLCTDSSDDRKRRRRRRRSVVLVLALIVLGIGLAVWWYV